MGTTSKGIPYPESSDPVRQGAAAMQAIAEAVDPHIGAYYAYSRRTGTGNFSSGTMTQIHTLTGPMPAGVYMIHFQWRISNSGNSTAYLRGSANSSNLTADEQVSIVGGMNGIWTIHVPYEHEGGTLNLVMSCQMASGTGSAPAGSRITVARVGVTIPA